MSLLATIKADQLTARKNRDSVKASLLTTLYSEAANVGLNDDKRETTDAETIAVIRKFLKNLNEAIEAIAGETAEPLVYRHEAMLAERTVYEAYLPTQMSEEQLTTFIRNVVAANDNCNVGVVMKELKAHCDGEYDGRMASTVAKAVLAE